MFVSLAEGSCEVNKWNSDGTGLMFEDYPFPIITLLNQTVADFLLTEVRLLHIFVATN